MDSEAGAIPWYRSSIIIGAFLSLLTKVLVVSGVISDLSSDDMALLTNSTVLIIGGLADIWAMRARVVQKEAPKIMSSQKAATMANTATTISPVTPPVEVVDALVDIPEASSLTQREPVSWADPSQEKNNG